MQRTLFRPSLTGFTLGRALLWAIGHFCAAKRVLRLLRINICLFHLIGSTYTLTIKILTNSYLALSWSILSPKRTWFYFKSFCLFEWDIDAAAEFSLGIIMADVGRSLSSCTQRSNSMRTILSLPKLKELSIMISNISRKNVNSYLYAIILSTSLACLAKKRFSRLS